MSADALKPDPKILVKLGSIVVHIEEFLSSKGHPYDLEAVKGLLADEELQAWLKEMDRMAFLPVKRK